jgi:protein-S-isoprenylcysteine O-methyltransferase Ste14
MKAEDEAGIRFPPPLVFLGFALLGWLAERRLPVDLGRWPDWIGWSLAVLLAGAGIFLIGAALSLFRRIGTPPEPWKPTAAITRDGVYGWTRNPMYLGMMLIVLAASAGLQSPGILFGAVLSLIAIDRFVVRREEVYLSRRFGEPYADYKASVRRWL